MQPPFGKKDALALSVIGLFCLYLFRDIVLSGHLLIGDDFVTFYLGMKKFLYDEVHLHHEIPYWNPFIFGGMPFWAHFESTIFYPLGFLFYLLSPEKAYGYTMFFHFFLAGVFMYLLARSMGISEAGGFVASAVFSCNGFLVAILFLGHLSPVESYIWLPLVIYFVNRAVHADEVWRSALIAGALWGIQILAGAPQDAFYTFLATALFVLCTTTSGQPIKPTLLRPLSIVLTVFAVGAGLSCIQILPAFELIGESVRAALDSYEVVTLASYPLQGIITILMPYFFGNYADGSVWVSNTPWSIPQQNLYTGVLPMVLLGFLSFKGSVERKVILFGGLLAVLALILAFGHHTPVYKLVYLLPGFDRFRAPSKIMVLWVFSMALLAGFGMDGLFSYLRKGLNRRLYLILFSVCLLLVLVIVFYSAPSTILKVFSPFVLAEAVPAKIPEAARVIFSEMQRLTIAASLILLLLLLMRRNLVSHSMGGLLLCALLLVDLGVVHGGAVRHDDSTYQRIAKLQVDLNTSLANDKSVYRVGAFEHPLGANLEMVLGYQTVGGFTALFPSRYYEYIDKYSNYELPRNWVSFFYGVSRSPVLMDLLNVKYEILYASRAIGFRETCLPRAFIVPDYRVARTQEVLDILTSSDFDPRKTVVFENEDAASLPGPRSRNSSISERVEIKTFRPDTLILDSSSQDAGYLFLTEIHYPGWKATIDDRPANILRGNYLFRVIPLPQGRHHIQVQFDPLTIKMGVSVSVVTLLVILGSLICFSWRKRIQGKR
jgi:Bacterial membrane protein YfhO